MNTYLGLSGLEGLDPNPAKHFAAYAKQNAGLGIRFGEMGHDATAAAVREGRVVFAVEEERLNRFKHFMGLPKLAAEACRLAAGASPDEIRAAYYFDPHEQHEARRVRDLAEMGGQAAVERDFADVRRRLGAVTAHWPSVKLVDHHLAHAASTFYCSGFDRALVMVADGQGESAATTVMLGDERGLHPVASYPVTASFGLLYSEITSYLGFEAIEDEYKIMGLAAYTDTDEYRAFFDEIMVAQPDGGFSIPSLTLPVLKRLREWGRALGPPRMGHNEIEPRHIAIAASLQRATERAMMRLLEHHQKALGVRHLCLSGGVALNCSMNGVIDRSGMFDELYVQPAAGDSGTALGAALVRYHAENPGGPRERLAHVYLGPEYDDARVRAALASFAADVTFEKPAEYEKTVAQKLADGAVIGWYQGRMEYGPRALGNRSILADPRRADMKDRVNKAVKKREEFRPFAPSTTHEGADAFFELNRRPQYETMTVAVKAKAARKAEIPSVVHVNGTSRVHVVRKELNPGYHALITRFGELTGVPVVMNTSFNVKGEPIVCTPEDAIRCFLGTGIDHLALQGYLVTKRG